MKLLIAILLMGVPSWGAITVVDTPFNQCNLPNTASGSCTATLTTSTTAGEAIFAFCINTNKNNFGASPITDSASGSYTLAWTNVNTGAGTTGRSTVMAYRLNVGAGVTSVTCTESASAGNGALWVGHAKGILTSNALDTSNSAYQFTNSPWASGSINTAQAVELVMGHMDAFHISGGNCGISLGGGWTSAGIQGPGTYDGSNGGQGAVGYQILSSTQTGMTFSGTDSNSACDDAAGIIAFIGQSASFTPFMAMQGIGK